MKVRHNRFLPSTNKQKRHWRNEKERRGNATLISYNPLFFVCYILGRVGREKSKRVDAATDEIFRQKFRFLPALEVLYDVDIAL